jgi:hypothetical protein
VVSHTRTSVPLTEVVASSLPDGVTARVVIAVLCATITECDDFAVSGGGGRAGTGGGGPMGTGGGQGGRWISCTCPGCRAGAARSVEYAPVAMAMTPNNLLNELRIVGEAKGGRKPEDLYKRAQAFNMDTA